MPVRSLYCDVDLTLVNDACELYPGVEIKLKQWYVKYELYCWSHGGKEHAKKICTKHKIAKYFKAFLDKPDIIVDDTPDFLLEFPAILKVENPDKWWKNGDNKLFGQSRDKEVK